MAAKHSTQTERDSMRAMILAGGGTAEQADALSTAVEGLAGLDLDLRDLKGAVHNTFVIAGRDPRVKAAKAERSLALAREAMESGRKIIISPNVRPKHLAYTMATVNSVEATRVNVTTLFGEHLALAPSLVSALAPEGA